MADAGREALRRELAAELRGWLERTGDDWSPGEVFMRRWRYPRGAKGEVPYTP